MLNFLFGSSRKSSNKSSASQTMSPSMRRRAARHTNLLIERVSAREDRAE